MKRNGIEESKQYRETTVRMEMMIHHGPIDFGPLIHLIRHEFPPDLATKSDAELVEMMNQSYDANTDSIIIATRDGKEVVGLLRYGFWPRGEAQTQTVHIFDIVVDEKTKRRGLGRLLFQTMIQEIQKQDVHRVLSRTLKTSTESIAFHHASGFTLDFETDDSIVWRFQI